RFDADGYAKPLLLKLIIEDLEKKNLNNRQIKSTLTGYFEDMYLCFKEMSSVLG
ncbi:unnamed protein product, partial [marine sediment metagenome]